MYIEIRILYFLIKNKRKLKDFFLEKQGCEIGYRIKIWYVNKEFPNHYWTSHASVFKNGQNYK